MELVCVVLGIDGEFCWCIMDMVLVVYGEDVVVFVVLEIWICDDEVVVLKEMFGEDIVMVVSEFFD